MPLPSILQRKNKATAPPAPPAADGGPVEAARTSARRRLIGAVVLLAIGVVGFPLLFETQPRPVAPDVVFEVPKKEVAPSPAARVVPAQTPPTAKAAAPALPTLPADAGPEAPSSSTVAASAPAVVAAAPAPAPAPPLAARASAPPVTAVASVRADDGARAKALLDDNAASAAKASRFVVQVGAYSDPAALREARLKVEKLGLKTYTQLVETEAGKRTRVRVGPFATREEADSASARLKAAGLPAVIFEL
jgi:DedD protein